jgi:hypothetical protein
MLSEWNQLLAQIEILEEGSEILNKEGLSRFEVENNILLPPGYKEFCQTFGTGSFGNFIRIYSPNQNLVEYSRLSLESISEQVELFPSENLTRDSNLQSLLENGFVFGDDFGANIAIWDLRTYSDLDKSYDIYWIDIDASDKDVYRVGRDFFEFVTDFCLGRGTYEYLPEDKRPPSDIQTFTRFACNHADI